MNIYNFPSELIGTQSMSKVRKQIVPLIKQDQQAFNIPNLITNFHDFLTASDQISVGLIK